MIDFSKRSYKKELLDRNDIPFPDIQQNLKELDFINTYLGGHSITTLGFKKLAIGKKALTVCEIGCGGGDNMNAIYRKWFKENTGLQFLGIDINADAIAYAKRKSTIPGINFIISDFKKVDLENNNPDIIFTSLFCHHFTNEELIEMMQWLRKNSKIGFYINDLHRHPLAYHFIKIATKIFSKSYLVQNDAPLSVLRGFNKSDWKYILDKAGITNYTIEWKWAFRYLITVKK